MDILIYQYRQWLRIRAQFRYYFPDHLKCRVYFVAVSFRYSFVFCNSFSSLPFQSVVKFPVIFDRIKFISRDKYNEIHSNVTAHAALPTVFSISYVFRTKFKCMWECALRVWQITAIWWTDDTCEMTVTIFVRFSSHSHLSFRPANVLYINVSTFSSRKKKEYYNIIIRV